MTVSGDKSTLLAVQPVSDAPLRSRSPAGTATLVDTRRQTGSRFSGRQSVTCFRSAHTAAQRLLAPAVLDSQSIHV